MRHVLLACTLGAALAAHGGDAVPLADDALLEARVEQLAAQLRCLVCQNQSLADSHAGLAIDLKNQVRDQLRAGRDETQVMRYMTERYGDFVLYKPPLKATTVLLWIGPALLVLLGMALGWRALARGRSSSEPTSPPIDAHPEQAPPDWR